MFYVHVILFVDPKVCVLFLNFTVGSKLVVSKLLEPNQVCYSFVYDTVLYY